MSALRGPFLFALMLGAVALVGALQSWNLALSIFNLCLLSGIMAIGVNVQWGYAGLFNVGAMGFAAIGGMAAVLVAVPPQTESWAAGGFGVLLAGAVLIATVIAIMMVRARTSGLLRTLLSVAMGLAGYAVMRAIADPATDAIEGVNAATAGYLGGMGMPILLSWIVGGFLAAGAAWLVGKISLGLRSDYLAIATLGISEIIIAMIKNEEWLTRGVKNVSGLPRPAPYEADLVQAQWFLDFCANWGADPVSFAAIFVKLVYAALFIAVLAIAMWLAEAASKSPWGRMMRAIRDNRDAASAMGKDVKARHLQVFILGSALLGVAGAMLATLNGQFVPGEYNPLRYTFLIWVMVIVGGSGNNWGAILGGFLIWFVWIEAEPAGLWLMETITSGMADGPIKTQIIDAGPHMRLLLMGVIMLVTLRYAPRGLLPERAARRR